jgi:hypothetical protein
MTRQEAIRRACQLTALVFRSIGDYSRPSDGFCDLCPAGKTDSTWNFSHSGITFEYILDAIVEKLKADGHVPDAGMLAEITDSWKGSK